MSSDIAIQVEGLSKRFEMYAQPRDRLLQMMSFGRRQYFKEFWALKNINFEIQKGETVGIIGPNGAGKSTLLQILCGTLNPTVGQVQTNGRVSALLELGSGFNLEFTGLENIYLNAQILGISREEISQKLQQIMEFAEIGDFIHQPVKTYSSGMYARLAFAVAVHVEPEILIVDETLSVGDMVFQAKAVQKMRELMANCTVLFVSHSLGTVKSFCNRAIFIDGGRVVKDGPASDVCDLYEATMQERLLAKASLANLSKAPSTSGGQFSTAVNEWAVDLSFPDGGAEFRVGSGAMRIIRADLMVNGSKARIASFGDQLSLRLVICANRDIMAGAIVGYMVRNANALDVFGRNIYNDKQSLPALTEGDLVEVVFSFKCVLSAGIYSISLGVKSEPYIPEFFDQIHVARTFEVAPIAGNYIPGLVYIDNDISITVKN